MVDLSLLQYLAKAKEAFTVQYQLVMTPVIRRLTMSDLLWSQFLEQLETTQLEMR